MSKADELFETVAKRLVKAGHYVGDDPTRWMLRFLRRKDGLCEDIEYYAASYGPVAVDANGAPV